ncbi:MAG: radical SAM protein [Candidatus Omnitrophota bacterium]|jgi:radical SAM superfamily enzyme YgiQ (UPF0313 family)
MKIALLELNHMTLGVHTNTAPLGIGVIAKYLQLQFGASVEVRLFKDAQKFMEAAQTWTPDVLGLGQYAWNSELNLFMARRLKERNSSLVVVAGGPNLELGSLQRADYLRKNPILDICVCFDGEIPMATIVQRLLAGESIQSIRKKPSAGTYSLDPDSLRLLESPEPPPRLPSLDLLGPMYAEGFFDEFLEDGYQPFLQTQRGCPFLCAYCHSGNRYHNKILFQSPSIFRQDMEYLGRRFRGNHNVTIHIANANFSLFKEDFEIADVIREIQEAYDWPISISVNSGKDPKKLMSLVHRLKFKFVPAIALQTLTAKVLKNIGRINIPLESFIDFQKEVGRVIESNPATELILSLPEETKASFMDTVRLVLNSGVQNIVIYTLMSLRGTELDTPEAAEKYGHVFRYRIVPRCFTEVGDEKIFEIEKVIVGTHSMPYEDYLELRGLALIIAVFASSIELMPLRRLLLTYGLDLAEWINDIHKTILGHPVLSPIYRQFIFDTEHEVYETPEAIRTFFGRAENFEALKEGKFGDNLMRRYKTILLSGYFKDCLDIAYEESVAMAKTNRLDLPLELLEDIRVFMKSRNIGDVFRTGYPVGQPTPIVLTYDIPRWLANAGELENLENYRGRFVYTLEVTDYIRKRLHDFQLTNRNPLLSLQILYRDGSIRDFWPIWVPVTQVSSK